MQKFSETNELCAKKKLLEDRFKKAFHQNMLITFDMAAKILIDIIQHFSVTFINHILLCYLT